MAQVTIENTPLVAKIVCVELSEDEVSALRSRICEECTTAFEVVAGRLSKRCVLTRKNWLTHETLSQIADVVADFARKLGRKVCVIVSPGQAIIYW